MIKKLFFALLFLFIVQPSFSQEFDELMKVVASDRDEEDRLGWSVDIDGDYAIVGAYADDFGGANPNMGSAYIYQKVGDEWVEIQKIFNSDQDDYDRFGWSVAIDGDFVVVGAYGEDHNVDDAESLSKAGSAYIFERNDAGVWEEVQKIVAEDRAADDEYGWSVAVHGTTVVVGAHNDDKDEDGAGFFYHAGSAYIYDRDVDGNWNFSQKIVASDRSPGIEYAPDHEDWNDRFGESVAIWNDYLVVGGPFASKAYVYERTGDTWTEVSFLTYPGISWLDRAAPVAIENTTIVLGAQTEDLNADGEESIMNSGGAAIFKRTGEASWTYAQKLSPEDRDAGDHFGISVGMSGDFVVIGTHSDNHDEFDDDEIENTGSLYVFELQDDGTYLEIKKLDASDRAEDDELGISVAISGNTIISGAWQQSEIEGGGEYIEDAGAAYFYSTDLDDEDCETVFASQDVNICEGGSYEIGDSSYDEEGTYTDVLTTIDGCDSIVTTSLEIIEPTSATQSVSVCAGGSITVGESTYDEAGTYTDILTSEFGCDSIVITTLSIDDEIVTETEYTICEGSSVAVGDNVYTEAGTYEDLFTTGAGCDSLVISTIIISGEIDLGVTVSSNVLNASATGVSYQWITCDPVTVIDGATDQNYEALENGDYAVIITNDDCTDTSDCYEITTIGLTEIENTISFEVYPNPSSGQVTITGNQINGTTLRIYNNVGMLVFEEVILNVSNTTINIGDVADGVYFVRLTNGNATHVEKLNIIH